MEDKKVIEIIDRVKNLLEMGYLYQAREYVQIEIENLKGITQERCKSTRYYFHDFYCQYCSNLNCANNKNKEEE